MRHGLACPEEGGAFVLAEGHSRLQFPCIAPPLSAAADGVVAVVPESGVAAALPSGAPEPGSAKAPLCGGAAWVRISPHTSPVREIGVTPPMTTTTEGRGRLLVWDHRRSAADPASAAASARVCVCAKGVQVCARALWGDPKNDYPATTSKRFWRAIGANRLRKEKKRKALIPQFLGVTTFTLRRP